MRWTCPRFLRERLNRNVGLNRGRTLANHIWGTQLSYSRTTALCRCAALRGPQGIHGHTTCSSTEYPLLQHGEAAVALTPLSPPPEALGVSHPHLLLFLPPPPSHPPSRSTRPTDTPGPSLSRTFPCPRHHCQHPDHHPSGRPRDSQLPCSPCSRPLPAPSPWEPHNLPQGSTCPATCPAAL